MSTIANQPPSAGYTFLIAPAGHQDPATAWIIKTSRGDPVL